MANECENNKDELNRFQLTILCQAVMLFFYRVYSAEL